MRYLAPFALLGTYLVYYKNRPVMDHILPFSSENNFFQSNKNARSLYDKSTVHRTINIFKISETKMLRSLIEINFL